MAELADAQVSEACDGDIVEVQVLSSAPINLEFFRLFDSDPHSNSYITAAKLLQAPYSKSDDQVQSGLASSQSGDIGTIARAVRIECYS